MTAKRELPFAGDGLAWVHNELADLKSRAALAQQAAEQSRAVASDAAEKAHQTRLYLEQFEGHASAIHHLQDELHTVREHIVQSQDDIHSLALLHEELDRRTQNDAERVRQDRNDIARRFTEIEKHLEGWLERFVSVEEMNRRNMEVSSQLAHRIDSLEAEDTESETLRSRMLTAISRIDQELQQYSSALEDLQREDEVHRERTNSAFESLRRLEGEIEEVRVQTNRIHRLDDRLELVQAERTRHNERLNELTQEMGKIDSVLTRQSERTSLIEARISGYQEDLRAVRERMRADRETISAYLAGLNDLLADIRKRQLGALEKEIRDIRGRAINFAEE